MNLCATQYSVLKAKIATWNINFLMTAYFFSFNISTERGGECELSLSFQRMVFLVLALGSCLCCGLNRVVLLLSLSMCTSRFY